MASVAKPMGCRRLLIHAPWLIDASVESARCGLEPFCADGP